MPDTFVLGFKLWLDILPCGEWTVTWGRYEWVFHDNNFGLDDTSTYLNKNTFLSSLTWRKGFVCHPVLQGALCSPHQHVDLSGTPTISSGPTLTRRGWRWIHEVLIHLSVISFLRRREKFCVFVNIHNGEPCRWTLFSSKPPSDQRLHVSWTCLRRKGTKQPPPMPAQETRRRNGCTEVEN